MKKKSLKIIFTVALFLVLAVFTSGYVLARSATVSWTAPAVDADGAPLTDLAGYKIYSGSGTRASGVDCPKNPDGTPTNHGYENTIDAGDEAAISYTFNDNLADGQTHHFSVTAVDTSGNESCFSNETNTTDVNQDAYINIKDIRLCIKSIINPSFVGTDQLQRCRQMDVQNDAVNIKDIRAIIREIINPS